MFDIVPNPSPDKIQLNLIKVSGSKKLGQQQVTLVSSLVSIFVQFKILTFQKEDSKQQLDIQLVIDTRSHSALSTFSLTCSMIIQLIDVHSTFKDVLSSLC